jgi:hypothetical protein
MRVLIYFMLKPQSIPLNFVQFDPLYRFKVFLSYLSTSFCTIHDKNFGMMISIEKLQHQIGATSSHVLLLTEWHAVL